MDKKEFTQKFKEIFVILTHDSILNPVTALNISYTYNKGDLNKLRFNKFFPRVQKEKKQGIGTIPALYDCRQIKVYNTIFVNYTYFTEDLKKALPAQLVKQLYASRHNPQKQLAILREIGI